jgi:hypothetical protein
MLRKINPKSVNVLIAIWLVFCVASPLFVSTPVEAAPNYTKEGDSVYTNTNGTYIKVTPHTLTSSGWVTVNFSSSKFTGDVDVCFGFNGVDQVKTVKSESWEAYDPCKNQGSGCNSNRNF